MLRFALVFAMFVPGLVPASGPQQRGVEATVAVAETLLSQGDSAAALDTAERVLAADLFNVEAHHLIQRILRKSDRAGMLARYQDLSRRYPGNPAAQYLLGNAMLNAEDLITARIYFDRALQLDPGFGWAASINAILAQVDGNPDEALRLGRVSVQGVRDDLLTATFYADLLRLNGLRNEAIAFLEQAAAFNPDEPLFLVALWKLRMRGVDDYEAERAAFAWQVAANRSRFLVSAELTAALASFYHGSAMGDPDGARDLWLTLADRFPADPEAKNALLRAATLTNDTDGKINIYSRILSEYPDSPIRYEVYYRLLREIIDAKDYARAKRMARSLTTEPDPGRLDDAQGVFEKPTE
jgi:tetratricopeptide (TPR) repeat protein